MSRKLRDYYVDGHASWYIVKAYNATQARANGKKNFGMLKSVRRATPAEVEYYLTQRDEIETATE